MAQQGYGKVRAPLDEGKLNEWCEKHVRGFASPCEVKQFSFGQSNPTYLLTDSKAQRYVLRKKPAGELLSKTAHAVEREFAVLKALGEKASGVPVPRLYALCTDDKVLGTPFYLMEYLDGRIFTDVRMPELASRDERATYWREIVKVLARLHSLDPDSIGLSEYGSKKPFYPRQIRSLAKVSNAQAKVQVKSASRASSSSGGASGAGGGREQEEAVGDVPGIETLLEWYARALPGAEGRSRAADEDRPRVVHGDFKCDNMVFHPTEPRIIGILDWELSTLGHPLSDLANLLQPWYIPSSSAGSAASSAAIPMMTGLRGLRTDDMPLPSVDELLRAYCVEVRREYPIKRWLACVSFAFFRLSVITQGIAARNAQGQASSAQAQEYGALFPHVGRLALEYMRLDTAPPPRL